MRYVTRIEERDGLVRAEIYDSRQSNRRPVALLACALSPGLATALLELVRVALEFSASLGRDRPS